MEHGELGESLPSQQPGTLPGQMLCPYSFSAFVIPREAKRSTSCSIDRMAMQRSRRTSGKATNKVDCDREKSRSARACASGTDSFWTCGEIVSGLAMMNRTFLFVVVGPWERFRALPWPALSRLPPESLLRRRPPCCCEEQEHCG